MNGTVFSFTTSGFVDTDDAQTMRPNENVGGDALAQWLSGVLKEAGFKVTETWLEDHGSVFTVTNDGRTYLCACSIEEDGSDPREGHVALELKQGFLDRLRGRNIFDATDALAAAIHKALDHSPAITGLERA